MNEDKPNAIETKCPTCDVPMEYVDGFRRAICHECGSQWDFTLLDNSKTYPTPDNPIQQMIIHYEGTQPDERLSTYNPSG